MSNEVAVAARAAKIWHHGQVRKFTGEPYFHHLVEVAGLTAMAAVQPEWGVTQVDMLRVAYLHDSVEDTAATIEELQDMFGLTVAQGVKWLTNTETGNRATRKALAAVRLSQAPGWAQTIKCADIIANTRSLAMYDPEFFKLWSYEALVYLNGMIKGDPFLRGMAQTEIRWYRESLLDKLTA